jgi:hypothetical protein
LTIKKIKKVGLKIESPKSANIAGRKAHAVDPVESACFQRVKIALNGG